MAKQEKQQEFVRFSAAQRFEHVVMLVSFTGLALTGLPQRYASYDFAKTMLDIMGGIESVRIVHRIMATILMLESVYHGGIISYKIFVLGERLTMIPTLKDAFDVRDTVRFNLGFSKGHPRMPRFNFGEKAEYLALIWGTLVMIFSGFMLWNPIAAAKLMPGSWIPAARAAHSAEALLAVLAIIIWHMYNVHIKTFNKSMFTGKMPRHEMEEEHAEELEMIEKGLLPIPPPKEFIAKRKRVFWPFALMVMIALISALFWFISFEETAIHTVPRLAVAQNVSLDVDPEVGQADAGALIWVEAQCHVCHGNDARGIPGKSRINIASTGMSFEAFAMSMRRGPAEMPAYAKTDLSDTGLAHLWVWLKSIPFAD